MTKFLDEAQGKLELSHGVAEGNEGLGLWTAAEAQAAALIAIAENLERINHKLTCALVMAERSLGSLADTDIGASVLELWPDN